MKLLEIKTFKELEKINNDKEKYKVQCKCGTKTIIANIDRAICRGCGHWIYKNKQIEFKYKTKELLKNAKTSSSTI